MGAYFSLREAGEWQAMLHASMEPSIWTSVNFTPLGRSQKMLLRRPGEVEFTFGQGLTQGDDVIEISEVADLAVIVGFDAAIGHVFTGLLLTASAEDQPHRYRRGLAEVTLRGGGSQSPSGKFGSGELSGGDSTSARTSKEGSAALAGGGTTWSHLLLYAVKEGILAFFANDVESCEQTVRDIAGSFGLGGGEPQAGAKAAPAAGGVDEATVKAKADEIRVLRENLKEEGLSGKMITTHPEVVRLVEELAALKQDDAADQAAAQAAIEARIKTLLKPIGRMPLPVCRVLTDLIISDLNRDFAVHSEPEDQADNTNCACFCMRIICGMKLQVPGYEVRRVCEERPDIGPIAGEAAGAAWDQLWRRVRV